jgi:hypothetical protein
MLSEKFVKWGKYFASKQEVFIKLPWFVKIIAAPVILVLFLALIFPMIIAFGLGYKFVTTIFPVLRNLYRKKKNIAIALETLLIFVLVTIPLFLVGLIAFAVLFTLIPFIPLLLLKIGFFIGVPYVLILLFLDKNKMTDEILDVLSSGKSSGITFQEAKDLVVQGLGEKAKFNPLSWLIKSPFTLLLGSSLLLTGGLVFLLLVLSFLPYLSPDIFFRIPTHISSVPAEWVRFLCKEIIDIIPIDFLGPFVPEMKTVELIQPWGGICVIFVQIFLVYLFYLVIHNLYYSYQYKISLRTNRKS